MVHRRRIHAARRSPDRVHNPIIFEQMFEHKGEADCECG
jgi:hypothetical protein